MFDISSTSKNFTRLDPEVNINNNTSADYMFGLPSMTKNQSTLETILTVCSALQAGPVSKSHFLSILLAHDLTFNEIEQIADTSLIDMKEDVVYLTDKGKEWLCHLGYLFGRRSLKSLFSFHRQTRRSRLVNDACSFIMHFIERLPRLESFWICSPWIVIRNEHRSRFKKCLEKVDRIHIITRPPEKTAVTNLRKSVEDSLLWLWDQGVKKISLHENVHAKVYLLEESADSWRHRILIIGSENLTFSTNPELSLCIYDDRLFREARARLTSLITGKRFKLKQVGLHADAARTIRT